MSIPNDLTDGSLAKHMVRLSVPMVWGIFAILSFQLIDAYFIGQIGTSALAAYAFTFPVIMVIMNIMFGFSIATSSVLSRKIGEGINDEVRCYTRDALLLCALVTIIITFLAILLHPYIFMALGVDKNLMPLVNDYMFTWYLGGPLIVLPIISNAAIRANGNAWIPSTVMMVIAIVNGILDPIFIFGYFGFPEMGLQGAALATVIANGVSMVFALSVLHFKDKMINWKWPSLNQFIHSAKAYWEIALPASLSNLSMPVFTGVVTALVALYGEEAVAAFGIASRIESFAFVIWIGVTMAMMPVIGQNFGKRKENRIKRTMIISIVLVVAANLFIVPILWFFANDLMEIFDGNTDVIKVGVLYFSIVPISYIFLSVLRIYSSALNGIGRANESLKLTIYNIFVFSIPLAVLGHFTLGLSGIFLAIAGGYILTFIIAIYFHQIKNPIYKINQVK